MEGIENKTTIMVLWGRGAAAQCSLSGGSCRFAEEEVGVLRGMGVPGGRAEGRCRAASGVVVWKGPHLKQQVHDGWTRMRRRGGSAKHHVPMAGPSLNPLLPSTSAALVRLPTDLPAVVPRVERGISSLVRSRPAVPHSRPSGRKHSQRGWG